MKHVCYTIFLVSLSLLGSFMLAQDDTSAEMQITQIPLTPTAPTKKSRSIMPNKNKKPHPKAANSATNTADTITEQNGASIVAPPALESDKQPASVPTNDVKIQQQNSPDTGTISEKASTVKPEIKDASPEAKRGAKKPPQKIEEKTQRKHSKKPPIKNKDTKPANGKPSKEKDGLPKNKQSEEEIPISDTTQDKTDLGANQNELDMLPTDRPRGVLDNNTAPSMADAPVTPEKAAFIKEGIETTLTQKEAKTEEKKTFEKQVKQGKVALGDYLEPWKGTDPHETVEMNFENKELTELLKFLSNNLDVTFILDDYIEPLRADGLQPLAGTKITFKSHVPLTLKQAWEIGLTFLEMAGFSVIPATLPRTYRVTLSAAKDKPSANREPLPTFIGSDPDMLPDNDTKIRYVYFADNAELSTIVQIVDALKSASAGPLIEVPPLKAVIMTDKSANIKSVMRIVHEIDRVTLPETLAIIRLRHADARQVRELYYRLIGKDPNAPIFNPFARPRKSSTTQYFTEATRVFEEPRTNSLIVLGTRDNIKRFEDFILKYVDKTLDLPFSPLHISAT